MQRLFRVITLGVVLTVTLPVSRLSAQATSPLIGTWDLNLAKSKFDLGPGPKSQTRTYEEASQGVKATITGTEAGGTPLLVQFIAAEDGQDYPVTGSPALDTISLKRVDAFTVEGTLKKAGRVVQTQTRVISEDGRTMTVTAKGMDANGQAHNDVGVFDKR